MGNSMTNEIYEKNGETPKTKLNSRNNQNQNKRIDEEMFSKKELTLSQFKDGG